MSPPTSWQELLADLIASGAEIDVRDEDGTAVFLAPLARHHRVDEGSTLWLRPIIGGYVLVDRQAGDPEYAFSLTEARPRGFLPTAVAVESGEVRLSLGSGQQVAVRPATEVVVAELDRWDTFVAIHLTGVEEAELDELQGTNWHGRWA